MNRSASLFRLRNHLHAIRGNIINLRRSKLTIITIAQVQICKTFKGNAVAVLFLSNNQWCSAQPVSRRINAIFSSSVKSSSNRQSPACTNCSPSTIESLFADQRCHQFGRIDLAAAHLLKVCVSVFIHLLKQFFHIIDLSNRCNCKASQMGLDQKRHRIPV